VKRLSRAIAASACAALFAFPGAATAQSTSPNGTVITVTVIDVSSGLPVPGAAVDLYQGQQRSASATTRADGTAEFAGEPAGIYHVDVRAQGYGSGTSDDVAVPPGSANASIRTVLQRSSLSAVGLREIGRVTSAQRGQGLQTSSTINADVSTERLVRQNYVRTGDALYVLPGVNLGSQDSAVGDDLSLNIRGIGSSETQVLLDGHPVGPFGAGGGSYNLQLSPIFALRNVEVIYGTGAQGIYGVDAIGGAVDLQLLNPTRTPQAQFIQGAGNQGKLETGVQATGTLNRLGYALESSTSGTYGQFAPGLRTQTGNLGPDISTPNLLANTYPVSAAYNLRDDLAKLTYAFSPKTNASFTFYGAYSYDDKTGNGDNDFVSYQEAYYNAQQGATVGQQIPYTDMTTPCPAYQNASTAAFPINTNSGVQCFNQSQFAQLTSGPAGGGQYRFQQQKLIDYTLRLNHQAGIHALSATAYTDDYSIAATRTLSPSESRFVTFGFSAGDDIVGARNTFGFGLTGERQQVTGNNRGKLFPSLGQATTNYYLKDEYEISPRVTAFANAWFKQSSVERTTTFDPRLSIVARPTANDVVRLSAARADDFPSVAITGAVSNFTDPGAVNVKCGDLTNIGSAPGEALLPEKADDIELAFGHRFHADSQIQVSLYDTNVRNQIINSQFILSQVPALMNDPLFLTNLQGYLAKFNSLCPQYAANRLTSAGQLAPLATVSTYANAASGRYQGIELSGRVRFSPRFYADYAYDTQVAYQTGFSTFFLQNNGNVVPGNQIPGIPLHKASLGVDFNDGHGFELRLDGFFVGDNNGYNRPSYTFFNGAATKRLGNTTLNLGIQNIFNQATQDYGLIGLGNYQPFNAVYLAANAGSIPPSALAEGSERFGLAPRAILFTVTQRVGGR
jgi:outer membrane receptor protein involved in Fe transport